MVQSAVPDCGFLGVDLSHGKAEAPPIGFADVEALVVDFDSFGIEGEIGSVFAGLAPGALSDSFFREASAWSSVLHTSVDEFWPDGDRAGIDTEVLEGRRTFMFRPRVPRLDAILLAERLSKGEL